MKDKVRDMPLGPKEPSLKMYAMINRFLKQFPKGRLTVRQLFYQLVASGETPLPD